MVGEQATGCEDEASRARPMSVRERVRFILHDYSVPIRFLLVGGLNTAFSYVAFAAIYMATHSDLTAVVLATIAGVLFNYFSTGNLVFSYKGVNRLPLFVLGYVVICTLNIFLLEALAAVGLRPLLGQLIVVGPLAIVAYYVNSRIVFRASR